MGLAYRIYDEKNKYIAATRTLDVAASLIAGRPAGSTIRNGHTAKRDAIYLRGPVENVTDLDEIVRLAEIGQQRLWDKQHVANGNGFACEVTTCGDNGKFSKNALVFGTRAACDLYGQDLWVRWTAVKEKRTVRVMEKPTLDQPTVAKYEAEVAKK